MTSALSSTCACSPGRCVICPRHQLVTGSAPGSDGAASSARNRRRHPVVPYIARHAHGAWANRAPLVRERPAAGDRSRAPRCRRSRTSPTCRERRRSRRRPRDRLGRELSPRWVRRPPARPAGTTSRSAVSWSGASSVLLVVRIVGKDRLLEEAPQPHAHGVQDAARALDRDAVVLVALVPRDL